MGLDNSHAWNLSMISLTARSCSACSLFACPWTWLDAVEVCEESIKEANLTCNKMRSVLYWGLPRLAKPKSWLRKWQRCWPGGAGPRFGSDMIWSDQLAAAVAQVSGLNIFAPALAITTARRGIEEIVWEFLRLNICNASSHVYLSWKLHSSSLGLAGI
jgi:hypothetical protein